ncbi:MAG: hypothetical protein ACKV0T_10520 [Planctomycetales bacterium]
MAAPFDESFDYLSLLGLDPAEVAVRSSDELRGAINRCKKEWTAQAINPLFQQQARANLERARQFEQLLAQPEALQAYLGFHKAAVEERRRGQDQNVGELLSLATGGKRTSISTQQHALLLKSCEERGIPPAVLAEALSARQLLVCDVEPVAGGGGPPYRRPALERSVMSQIAGHLQVLGRGSFYEVLDVPAQTSPAKLLSVARILYDRWSKSLPKTSLCIAWEKSLQACLTFLQDQPAKDRYDNALYNRRLDDFLGQVDLLLASGKMTRGDFALLVSVGMEEFGLSSDEAHQVVRWRASIRGLSLARPIQFSISMADRRVCRRCGRLVAGASPRCPKCGTGLEERCRNPDCGQRVPVGDKHCGRCGLASGRGVQFAGLLELAEALLSAGDHKGMLDACRLAQQILATPRIEALVSRAAKVRTLAASIRRGAADRRWSRVERELHDLLTLAPYYSQPGVPQLEEVRRFLAQLRQQLGQIPADAPPESEARLCLELFQKWSDCDELWSRLHRLLDALEIEGRNRPALEIAQQFASQEPLNEDWQTRIVRLQHRLLEERDLAERGARAYDQFREALGSRKLYTAEKLLFELEGLNAEARAGDVAVPLRERLARIRNEVGGLRQLQEEGVGADELIARHLALLESCRDCRESLAALQSLTPLAPQSPVQISIAVQGSRRVITWRPPPNGPAPTHYLVERSVQRPAPRPADSRWTVLFEGSGERCLDDEVLQGGAIVRYSVTAQRTGALTVAGDVLREYALASAPLFSEPKLLWQEVLGLRSLQRTEGLELTWHRPAGVRQVVIERWTGLVADFPVSPDRIPESDDNHLLIDRTRVETPLTLRFRCLYDGPAGDFLTPGATVTLRFDAAGGVLIPQTPPSEIVTPILGGLSRSAGLEEGEVIATQSENSNPMRRLGIWPPVPQTG